jgi:outer membrane protein assembly factor BamA
MFTKRYILPFLLLPLLFSCSTTKFVPENQYLLNRVTIDMNSRNVSSSDLENYVQQRPNRNFLFLRKPALRIYSLSGRDTTKWRNRVIRRLGEPPVIFSVRSMRETERQLAQRMQNWGYLNAEVTADTIFRRKKANVTYRVQPNASFTIRNYEVGITDTAILSIMATPRVKRDLRVRPGIRFVPEELDRGLQVLTNSMRNRGFYHLSKENFFFLVDSSLQSNQVDVKLMIRDTWENKEDSIRFNAAFNRYYINAVTIISGYDQFDPDSRKNFARPDTVHYRGLRIIYGSRRFIRRQALSQNCFIRPGHYYSDRLMENTYSSMNSMSAVKQANIYFREVSHPDSSLLNTFITIAPANIYHWQTGLDGTNAAGDLGLAGYVTFQNQNMFNGSETFRVRLNGGVESVTSSGLDLLSNNFYQYGVDFSLTFPRFLLPIAAKRFREQASSRTIFKLGVNWQSRPEYDQRFVDIDWMYRWSALRNRLNHTLEVYNVNYIITPRMSDAFLAHLNIPSNAFLKESYTDRFITRSSYSFVYASLPPSRVQNEGYTIRAGMDVAGTLPYLLSIISWGKAEDGTYKLFKNPFAQYVKVSADYARFLSLNSRNILALHAGLGIASPYLNSSIIPYEQRYFAGGPNSVRGWNTRTLGPGTYKSGGRNDFINQNGDIKILLNMEYRMKTKSFMEYAAFVDAGNVWTIRDYDNQPEGLFKLDSFWKEMGLSWGIGFRPNFGFILIRVDFGMKIYSPESLNDMHWVITRPNLSRDVAFHFAVGYPF